MRTCLLAALAVLALQPAFAQTQPSEKSVLQLLQVMHTHQIMDNASAQMDATVHNSMKLATQGQLNPEQEKIREESQTKLMAIVKDELNWSTVEPLLVQAYQSTFTQEEVSAMLSFYDSPIGQSVGAKLPTVNQQLSQLMQQRTQELIPKLVEVQKEMAARIKAAASGAPAQAPAAQPAPH
jgi:uncharacterized protein